MWAGDLERNPQQADSQFHRVYDGADSPVKHGAGFAARVLIVGHGAVRQLELRGHGGRRRGEVMAEDTCCEPMQGRSGSSLLIPQTTLAPVSCLTWSLSDKPGCVNYEMDRHAQA